jgi:hypothetical protein
MGSVLRDASFAGSPAIWTVPAAPGLTGFALGLWWIDVLGTPAALAPPNVLRL